MLRISIYMLRIFLKYNFVLFLLQIMNIWWYIITGSSSNYWKEQFFISQNLCHLETFHGGSISGHTVINHDRENASQKILMWGCFSKDFELVVLCLCLSMKLYKDKMVTLSKEERVPVNLGFMVCKN